MNTSPIFREALIKGFFLFIGLDCIKFLRGWLSFIQRFLKSFPF